MTSTNGVNEESTTPITSSKNSILQAVVGDGSFEQLMKDRSRIRREKDEQSIAEIRVQLASMENGLSAEIKRRVDLNRKMERHCQIEISDMQNQFQKTLSDRASKLQERISQMEEQIVQLNGRLEEEKIKIPKDIENLGTELNEKLRVLKEEFEIDRKDRIYRGGRILKQMTDFENHMKKQTQQMIAERDSVVKELKDMIEHNESVRKQSDEKFQKLIDDEFTFLKQELERETRERKMEDDEIVAALNRYTANLQSSLSVISSNES